MVPVLEPRSVTARCILPKCPWRRLTKIIILWAPARRARFLSFWNAGPPLKTPDPQALTPEAPEAPAALPGSADVAGTTFMFPRDGGHRLHVRLAGNPQGRPVLVLHGGPGSGCGPRLAELYDPARCLIILPDQRGAGLSEPHGATQANTTPHLIDDLEALRTHLGIARWCVTGGSWGACLALAYAQAHPQACTALVLRSSFLPGMGNVNHFFAGLAVQYPVAWAALDAASRGPGVSAAPRLLDRLAQALADEPTRARAAALAWWRYEQHIAAPEAPPPPDPSPEQGAALVRKYRLQAHYLQAGCFLDEAEFLARCRDVHVPVHLIHGLDDQVCPPANTRRLAEFLPRAQVHWVERCGHDPFHGGMLERWMQVVCL